LMVVPGDWANLSRNFSSAVIGGDAKDCKESFMSGAVPSEGKDMVRVFTTCQVGLRTLTRYYLGFPRPNGGAYVMSTASTGDAKPVKDADSDIRTAVFKIR